MKKAVTTIALLVGFTLIAVPEVLAMAQISLQNNTSFWLNLYIDGNFGCGPVMPSGFCVSSVTPGSRVLDARKRGDTSTTIASETVNIGDGTSPTWTVTIEDPDQALIKKLDGARYVIQQNTAGMEVSITCTLDIKGTTLVQRCCVTWARPDIAQSMATGTNGFPRRPVGTWYDIGQAKIVGRVAHIYDKNEDKVFTIREDGNNITEEIKGYINIYHRQ